MSAPLFNMSTSIKPASAAASIFLIDKFIVKQTNMQQTLYIAGGVGAGFLLAKIVSPMISDYIDPLIGINTQFSKTIQTRAIEVATAGGTLYGLSQSKLISLPSNKNDIITLAVTIIVADMLSEELLPFFGFDVGVHN